MYAVFYGIQASLPRLATAFARAMEITAEFDEALILLETGSISSDLIETTEQSTRRGFNILKLAGMQAETGQLSSRRRG